MYFFDFFFIILVLFWFVCCFLFRILFTIVFLIFKKYALREKERGGGRDGVKVVEVVEEEGKELEEARGGE